MVGPPNPEDLVGWWDMSLQTTPRLRWLAPQPRAGEGGSPLCLGGWGSVSGGGPSMASLPEALTPVPVPSGLPMSTVIHHDSDLLPHKSSFYSSFVSFSLKTSSKLYTL